MNIAPFKKMFLQPDGSLDEIVVAILGIVVAGLVLEFRTYWNPPPTVVFSLEDFGKGAVGLGLAAGVWWKARSMGDNPHPPQTPPTL